VAELGVVTRALLAIARDGVDDRVLAMRICRACVDGRRFSQELGFHLQLTHFSFELA
jgi:hypothetical protein